MVEEINDNTKKVLKQALEEKDERKFNKEMSKVVPTDKNGNISLDCILDKLKEAGII